MNRLEICKRSLGTFSRCNKTKNSCHFVFYAAIIFSKKEKVFLLVGLYLEHLGMKNYQVLTLFVTVFPASIYLFRVNNRNNRRRCKICSKLTIKTLERRQFSDIIVVFLLLTLNIFLTILYYCYFYYYPLFKFLSVFCCSYFTVQGSV